jgi:hypothetical protein
MSPVPHERPFPYLDDLRRAYDRGASDRHALEDLQWRLTVQETWLLELPSAARLLELGPGTGQLAAQVATCRAPSMRPSSRAFGIAWCQGAGYFS